MTASESIEIESGNGHDSSSRRTSQRSSKSRSSSNSDEAPNANTHTYARTDVNGSTRPEGGHSSPESHQNTRTQTHAHEAPSQSARIWRVLDGKGSGKWTKQSDGLHSLRASLLDIDDRLDD